MLPLISVIVPVYNGAAYLPQCLDSLLAQTFTEMEILLINDGSADSTPAVCGAYAQRDRRIRYISQENQGLAATRNIGIQAARGEYLSFVDADDWVEPTYLSYLYELLQANRGSVSACNHWVCRERGKKPRFGNAPSAAFLPPEAAFRHILYDRFPDVSAWGKLYARDVFKEIAYPQGYLFEDTFRIAEIILAGGGVVFGGAPQYSYRILPNSISRGKQAGGRPDFLLAVEHMTDVMAAGRPELSAGIARRRMHAMLSVRRGFVGCGETDAAARDSLERKIRGGAAGVLKDLRAPLRDKAGILSVLLGPGAYDALWRAYEGMRKV